MGDYLSCPKVNKESSDVEGDFVRCGFSSMQGWRASQEDAHNCILDFDKNTSFFAVYDGHGGSEVSEYCSRKLPYFLKETENYVMGNYEQALKDAFIGFDASLTTNEAIEDMKLIQSDVIKKKDSNTAGESSESESEEAISSLVQEAHMPLDLVMAKYKANLKSVAEGKPPVSPMLRARRNPGDAACSSSSAGPASSTAQAGGDEVSSSSNTKKLCNGDVHINGEVDDKSEAPPEGSIKISEDSGSSSILELSTKGKSDSINLEEDRNSLKECKVNYDIKRTEAAVVSNGESHQVTSSTESTAEDNVATSSSPKRSRKLVVTAADIFNALLQSDESDSEEEDETFTADPENGEDSSDTEDDAKDDETGDGEDEDGESVDNEEEEDEEEEDDDEDVDCKVFSKEVPGSDSGSTAVVALLVGNQLYVANAGDSRCVVGCADGQAIEMSFDHKPEDEPERKRIESAGGRVSFDGRVNGGLNLSRAIGDHSYKQSKELPASEQMITALPDVKTLTIDPSKENFMVIACDGIWNSMSSQEVVDFVRNKLEQKTEPLSRICEEMFDHCLAPNTLGDGTGCDNMTCVIVQFKSPERQKRPAEELPEESCPKRSKIEVETS